MRPSLGPLSTFASPWEAWRDPIVMPRSRVVMAQIHQVDDDPAGALQLLDEAEAAYVSEFFPDVRRSRH